MDGGANVTPSADRVTGPAPGLYVYYRIAAHQVDRARAAARRAAALIEAAGAKAPRLMRRPEADREGRQTWMEVYDPWKPSMREAIARAILESGLLSLTEGERHEELFEDLETSNAPYSRTQSHSGSVIE